MIQIVISSIVLLIVVIVNFKYHLPVLRRDFPDSPFDRGALFTIVLIISSFFPAAWVSVAVKNYKIGQDKEQSFYDQGYKNFTINDHFITIKNKRCKIKEVDGIWIIASQKDCTTIVPEGRKRKDALESGLSYQELFGENK